MGELPCHPYGISLPAGRDIPYRKYSSCFYIYQRLAKLPDEYLIASFIAEDTV
jgi:hypothetical protein